MRALLAVFLAASMARAQDFGQNQVITKDFDWKVRSTDHFDIYYYKGSQPMVQASAEILEDSFAQLARELDILVSTAATPTARGGLQKWERRPFFLYASPNDFHQSNIVAVGEGTGGVTEPFKDRFMIYNDGTLKWLEEVAKHEFVHIMQFHVLLAGFWKSARIVKSVIYPLWMIEGMAGHYTRHLEETLEEITIRDAATSGGLLSLTRLDHFGHLKPHQITLAYKQGAAAMEFLETQFGKHKVRDFLRLFESRYEANAALAELVGLDAFAFDKKYREYLETKYRRMVDKERLREPQAYGEPLTRTRDKIPQFNTSPVFSPDGHTAYYVTTSGGHPSEIHGVDLRTGKVRRVVKTGRTPVENVPMGNFANLSRVLAISPDGRSLAFAGTRNHVDAIYLYDLKRRKLTRLAAPGFMSVAQVAFSPDGWRLAFSGMKDSLTDIYVYDLRTRAITRLTNDPRDDEMPAFTRDGAAVIYSSEVADPVFKRHERRLYVVDLAGGEPRRLEDSGGSARDPVVSADGKRVLFIREGGGRSEVAELDLEKRRVRALTRSIGACFTPIYAPDGDIAFSSLRRGNVHVYKGKRADFLGEEAWAANEEPTGPEKFRLPGMGGVAASSATVTLGPERPYNFSFSTDLFLPAFFYSSEGGFFWTSYWQGSDLLGNHQLQGVMTYSSQSSFFDYTARYGYNRLRPQFVAGMSGRGQRELYDPDRNVNFNYSQHAQFASIFYPFDRYHRAEVGAVSVSERFVGGLSENRETRLASYSLVRDTVGGRYLVATKGDRVRLSYAQAGDVLGGTRRYDIATGEVHRFIETGSQSALALRGIALQTLGPDRPAFLLGGLGGVRGYGRNPTDGIGNRLAAANAEYRFPIFSNLNYYMWYFFPDFYFKSITGALFADIGRAWSSSGELERTRWTDVKQSVGVGLRIHTFILQQFPLVVHLDYAAKTTERGGIFYVYLGPLF